MQGTNTNTILIVILILIVAAFGAYWYVGHKADADKPAPGLQINLGSAPASSDTDSSY